MINRLMIRFKEILSPFKYMLSRLLDSFKVYSLTLVIPITGFIMSAIFMILKNKSGNPFFIFRAFYYDYYFLDIIAWRWHSSLYLLCLICCLIREK